MGEKGGLGAGPGGSKDLANFRVKENGGGSERAPQCREERNRPRAKETAGGRDNKRLRKTGSQKRKPQREQRRQSKERESDKTERRREETGSPVNTAWPALL